MRTDLKNNILTLYLEGKIDSNNAAETEAAMLEAIRKYPEAVIVLDAENLEYISSAGLRALMALRRHSEDPITVKNVSLPVYEIFEMTGFTELFDVQKVLRSVSAEGLEIIGRGNTATVYRLDREMVLKVFNPGTSPDIIRRENELCKNAFVSGIPTAISYDVVQVGDCFGAVYELLDAEDFLTVIENDKEHLDDYIRKFAVSIRKMHKTEVDTLKFPNIKADSLSMVPLLDSFCTKEEIEKLQRLFESIPDRSTFIHGDCHPGNVMVQGGELVFIDMMTCGTGHPVFDLTSMCTNYHMSAESENRENNRLLRNFTKEETARIWDIFLRSYLETEDEEFLRKAEHQITAVSSARILFSVIYLPGLFSDEQINGLKHTALTYVDDGLEPLVF